MCKPRQDTPWGPWARPVRGKGLSKVNINETCEGHRSRFWALQLGLLNVEYARARLEDAESQMNKEHGLHALGIREQQLDEGTRAAH